MPPLSEGRGAKALFEHGADPKLTDGEGKTMITRAAASDVGLNDALRLLIAKGVDVNARDKARGHRAGHRAAARPHDDG